MLSAQRPSLARTVRLAFLWLAAISAPAFAVEMNDLYTVSVPIDSTTSDPRADAYARGLGAVLVRITGDEAAAQSEDILGLFPNPARYVLQYSSGDDDSLEVSFDGAAIEALVRRAGHPVWSNDRPLTVVWVAVDWGLGEREIIGADDPEIPNPDAGRSIDRNRQLRERVLDAAARRGIPVLFPLLDTEDLQGLSFSDIWGGFDGTLMDKSRRYGATSVLVGRVRGDDPFRNRWSYTFNGRQFQWQGGPETVINLLADALAEQFAFAGNAPAETVTLSISGIDSVQAYGTVQRFLADQSLIESYAVTAAAGDEIRFAVRVRGGADRLSSALEFSGILQRSNWLDAQEFFGSDRGTVDRASIDYVYRPFTSSSPSPEVNQPEDESQDEDRRFPMTEID